MVGKMVRAPAAAPCGTGTVTLVTATTPASPAMPRERMNEWPGNHGHHGPGNADSRKQIALRGLIRPTCFVFESIWRLRSEQLELNKRKEVNGL